MAPESHPDVPLSKGGGRAVKWWRLRWLKVCVGLVAGYAVFWQVDYQLAEHAWRQYREDAARRGVKLDLEDYLPAAIPDEENFAAIPVFEAAFARVGGEQQRTELAELPLCYFSDRNRNQAKDPLRLTKIRSEMIEKRWLKNASADAASDILRSMVRVEPELDQIRAAVQRPKAFYPVERDEGGYAHLYPFSILTGATHAFGIRARALLALQRPGEALDEWRCMMRIQQSLEFEPSGALVSRRYLCGTAVDVAMAGIAFEGWSEAALEAISKEAESVDTAAAMWFSLWCERAINNRKYNHLVAGDAHDLALYFEPSCLHEHEPEAKHVALFTVLPRGWLRRNQIAFNELADRAFAAESATINSGAGERECGAERTRVIGSLFRSIQAGWGVSDAEGLMRGVRYFQRWKVQMDVLRMACALERYRLQHGDFPGEAGVLVPQWMEAVPVDVMDGKALRYWRNADGSCDVWSVAMNRVDDGGLDDQKDQPVKGADWVWHLPSGVRR